MIISFDIDGRTFAADTSDPLDLSIPLRFNGSQPNAYGVDPAVSKPCQTADLTGDTRLGGSCNFEQYSLIPHCHGTHTEGVGHITKERIPIRTSLKDSFDIGRLITVRPEKALATDDTYPMVLNQKDQLITMEAVRSAFTKAGFEIQSPKSLLIRTLPNDETKLTRDYVDAPPPFFSNEALEYIVESGIDHLLVDLPSVDRMFDDGKLSNHRIFWKIDQGSFELSDASRRESTITELIFVPEEIEDGDYLINFQITAFETDASPSRPVLFRIIRN